MKKFLFKICIFLIPIVIIIITLRWYIQVEKSSVQHHKLPKNIETLILGHSQPETAINDSLLSNCKNFSQGGEAYLFTYAKLRYLATINPQIKRVYLSFSNNQISTLMEEWTFGDRYLQSKYTNYFYALSSSEQSLLWRTSFYSLVHAEYSIMKTNGINLIKNKGTIKAPLYWGDYLYLKRFKTDSLLKSNYLKTIKKNQKVGISKTNLVYLDKIVRFCNKKKIKLIFFRTPIHPKLFEILNEKQFQSIRKKKYASIPFVDAVHYPISNEAFGDLEHLNYKGAKKFSLYFNDLMQNH
jgi:hypothetical protein